MESKETAALLQILVNKHKNQLAIIRNKKVKKQDIKKKQMLKKK
jgi:hypothetical protein